MTAYLDTLTTWWDTHPTEAWTAVSVAALIVAALITYEVVNRTRRASRGVKELIGYSIVQVGMAYVTITGGYDFWHHIAHMPKAEAAAVAVIVESAQWWFFARVFRHMAGSRSDGTPNVGYGPAGPRFWASVFGGGILAVAGAFAPGGGLSLAIGRAVVVYIGASMMDLLLREKVRQDGTTKRPTWLITPRRLLVMVGWMSAEERDLRSDNQEWTLRRMVRAIRRINDGNRVMKWLGKRTLLKAMEGGSAGLMAEATDRYAMSWLLTNEVGATSATMTAAIDRARATINPSPPTPAAPATPPPPAPEPVAATVTVAAPKPPPRRTLPEPKTAPTNAEREQLRVQAVTWAIDQLRGGSRPTAKQVGREFGNGEEWGRQRLIEARRATGEVTPTATVNGSAPNVTVG